MRGRQISYRLRRRVVALTVLALVGGGLATVIVLVPRGQKLDRGPTSPPPPASQADTQRGNPTPTHLTPADEDQLRTTIALFVSTSVSRHHPERSWSIVHPSLREGLTKRQWSTGNIPVVPYPAAGVDLFTLQAVVGQTVLAEVVLEPSPKSNLVRKTFLIKLRRAPRALHEWLVSDWVPEGVSESQIDRNVATEPVPASHMAHFSAVWIYVLVGVLGSLLLLVPTGLFVRDAYQSRRALSAYRQSRSEPDELPR